MNTGPAFLGVYIKTEASGEADPDNDIPAGARCHVWSLTDGDFLLKRIDGGEEQSEPFRINADDFFMGYRVGSQVGENKPGIPQDASEAGAAPAAPKGNARTGPETPPQRAEREERAKPAWRTFSLKQRMASPSAEAAEKSNEKIEDEFRTRFSLAIVRMVGDPKKGLLELEKLADDEGPFAKEHKFMFTDCGTALRKRKQSVLAMRFHQKARLLAPDDEHVLFNMARVLYDNGQIDKARECLAQALEMDPGFKSGHDFMEFLNE